MTIRLLVVTLTFVWSGVDKILLLTIDVWLVGMPGATPIQKFLNVGTFRWRLTVNG